MSEETLQSLAVEPFPPYQGIENGSGSEGMYPSEGDVVTREDLDDDDEFKTKQFEIQQDADGDLLVTTGRIRTAELAPKDDQALWGMDASETIAALTAFTPTVSKDYYFYLQLARVAQGDEGEAQGSPNNGALYMETTSALGSSVVYKEVGTGVSWTLADQINAQALAQYNYLYLGKAEVDAQGDATITQEDFGPFDLPQPTYLYDMVSTEANNGLTEGGAGDGHLFVAVIDDDVNNQLRFNKAGGDVGAYLRVAAGAGLAIDEGTQGAPSLSVSPASNVTNLAADDGVSASGTYVQAELQAAMNKIDAILAALEGASLMAGP